MLGRMLARRQRSQQQHDSWWQWRWRWRWSLVAAVTLGLPAALRLAPVDAPTLPPAVSPIFRALTAARPAAVANPAPYLGLTYLSVAADDRGASETGIIVASVEPGSPAAAAGIRAGDTLLALDGRTFRRADSLLEALRTYYPEQPVTLTLLRGGETWDTTVHLAVSPQQAAQSSPDR